jgi:hypothetical protein
MSKNTPPKIFKRNEFGLIEDETINYTFNEDGTINWRKMIKSEFLVPNKQWFERKGKSVPPSIEGLEDNQLLILLGGIKELAQTRGFNSVNYEMQTPASDYIAAVCSINWIPNYETEGRAITFSAIGDASPFNTNSFGKNYLGSMAENRAFVRAVRNFLKINIVSQEELGSNGGATEQEGDASSNLLKEIMTAYGVSFDKIKETLMKDKFEGAELLTRIDDIPKFKQFELIERIKKAATKPKT